MANPSHSRFPISARQPSLDEPRNRQSYEWMLLVGMLAAMAITMALYLPHLGTEFVEWDLVPYQKILVATNYGKMAWALFTDLNGVVVSGYYAPIGSISLMLDKALIGSPTASPQITSFINLLFHCINGLLVFALLRRAGGSGGVALLGAFIFLVHPVQVASVAWFAQRKGVLATAFYLAAFLAYFRYMEKGGFPSYLCALSFFLLALLTKPTAIVLPAALFCGSLIVALPLQKRAGSYASVTDEGDADSPHGTFGVPLKIPPSSPKEDEETAIQLPASAKENIGDVSLATVDKLTRGSQVRDGQDQERWLGLPSKTSETGDLRQIIAALAGGLKPLVPFFLLAVGMALAVTMSERVGMDERVPDLSAVDRSIVSATAIWFYLAKVIVPVGFAPIYPQWDVNAYSPIWWLPLAGLLGALALVWRFRREIGAFPLWCLANFIIPLLPVIGIVKFAYLRHSYVADHFMYLPMVGLAGLLAACVKVARTKLGSSGRYLVPVTAAAYLTFCCVQTASYSRVWENSVALWSYNLTRNPNNGTAHTFLGHALLKSGKPGDAANHFQKTVALNEQYISKHEAHVQELQASGEHEAARKQVEKIRQARATLGGAYHNLGNTFLLRNMHHEAIAAYKRAIELRPDLVDAWTNLGIAYATVGNSLEAVRCLLRAVRINPQNYQAHYNLGVAYDMAGNKEMAEIHFKKARAQQGK